MRTARLTVLLYVLMVFWTTGLLQAQPGGETVTRKERFQGFSTVLAKAEKEDDLITFTGFYEPTVMSMPEYQPILCGIQALSAYYKELFRRQRIHSNERTTQELIDLGKTVIEIGSFRKTYSSSESDSVQDVSGKFCTIWKQQPDHSFKIAKEAFGFFTDLPRPADWVVSLNGQSCPAVIHDEGLLPFELRAYNALVEKYVRNGKGALRSQFFTNDGQFMPFAHPTVKGITDLRDYLVAYDTRSPEFHFDSLEVVTYDFEYIGDYVLEYPRFFVKWRMGGQSGHVQGKNIRIWRRQPDHSLKLYLELSTHDLLP